MRYGRGNLYVLDRRKFSGRTFPFKVERTTLKETNCSFAMELCTHVPISHSKTDIAYRLGASYKSSFVEGFFFFPLSVRFSATDSCRFCVCSFSHNRGSLGLGEKTSAEGFTPHLHRGKGIIHLAGGGKTGGPGGSPAAP